LVDKSQEEKKENTMRIEQKLASLGITLPPQTAPVGSFVPTVRRN
jgi:hypothetical protein